MKYGRYGWSHLLMGWGIGIVFLWIGLDIFRHPEAWIGYIPAEIPGGLSREAALQLNGAFDVALGVVLLLGWWPKIAATLAVAHLIAILATQGINAVIIRDVGLLGTALALLMWPTHRRRRGNRFLFFFKRKTKPEYTEEN